jgi:hypothetical protein
MSERLESVFMRAVSETTAEYDALPRICGPFPALVRGRNALGKQFESETTVDDLSALDLNLRLRQPVQADARLFAVVRLHRTLVAMHGIVLRAEPLGDGLWRFSIAIVHNRFLS